MPDLSDEIYNLIEITENIAIRAMELRAAGTCARCGARCGSNSLEMFLATWEIGGELRMRWVCEKCIED